MSVSSAPRPGSEWVLVSEISDRSECHSLTFGNLHGIHQALKEERQ